MKKIISIITVISIICGMSACSLFDNTERKLRDSTDEFMIKAKEYDLAAMNKMTSSGKTFNVEGLNSEDNKESDDIVTEKIDMGKNVIEDITMSYMKYCAAKIKYEIKSIDKENLQVNVSYEYIDSTNFITKFMEAYIKALFDGKIAMDASEEEQKKKMEEISDQILKDNKDEFLQKNVVLEYEKKDDDIYLLKDNADLMIVLTANMEEGTESAQKSTEQSMLDGLLGGDVSLPDNTKKK